MIKKIINYTNYKGEPRVKEAYFHISKLDMMDNIDIREEIEDIQLELELAPEGDLNEKQTFRMINMVKRLIEIAYGERSEDGESFVKSKESLEKFTSSPAYEELIFSVFQNPEVADEFIIGLMPPDLVKEAEESQRLQPQDRLPKKEKAAPSIEKVEYNENENAKYEEEIARLKAELEGRADS